MSLLRLDPAGLRDAEELLAFETLNRAFFESMVNSRPASFYSPDGIAAALALAEREASEDRGYQYLIRHASDGRLIGRINLIAVRRKHFHSAELGYRLAEAEQGQGFASEAVRLMLAKAFGELGLLRLEANARVANVGSQRVLLKNGFVQFGHSRRSFQLDGVWHDRLHYEWHAA
ncbi:GNAT family protein [Pelomonas sp. SE-A7]|uniref:GNAT family N-acetyltransferase n=1 Tax=Pelomonas sp. SE-A7 TaxID=3054953 RepID=UPI00259D2543|nr:GNAT family protein [Pelomonas sp. SE-A7]MDM4767660.1 GNAT family protein [Pelomonas sp. SE-A7]